MWMVSAALSLSDSARAQPMNEIGYDDDRELDFEWKPAEGTVHHYNVYVSEDGGGYKLDGKTLTKSYTLNLGADTEIGHSYRIKVTAVTSEDLEGPFSPESDPVVYDPLAPSGDNDSDGIPNYLEYFYRKILDAEDPSDADVDSDGDGYANYEEFLAGTDPESAVSVPPKTTSEATAVKVGRIMSLTWYPFGNGKYTVQWINDLITGAWQDAEGIWPTTETFWAGENISGIRKRFYRVMSQDGASTPSNDGM